MTWVTANTMDESAAHLAAFEGGLLGAWKEGTSVYLAKFDAAGGMKGTPEAIQASLRDKDDFWSYPNGDVGWIGPGAAGMTIYRYKACP